MKTNNVVISELTMDEVMNINGGSKGIAKALLIAGGAVGMGLVAPIAGAAFGTAAFVGAYSGGAGLIASGFFE